MKGISPEPLETGYSYLTCRNLVASIDDLGKDDVGGILPRYIAFNDRISVKRLLIPLMNATQFG